MYVLVHLIDSIYLFFYFNELYTIVIVMKTKKWLEIFCVKKFSLNFELNCGGKKTF